MEHTQKTKDGLSKMRAGKNNPFYNCTHTEEAIARIRAASGERSSKGRYTPRESRIKIPNDAISLGYLAGIIDGEGSIRFRKDRPFVAVYNTSMDLMNWLIDHVGGGITGVDRRGRELSYQWSISAAREVYLLCNSIDYLLIIKRNDAVDAITFLEEKYGVEVLNG